MNKYTFRFFVLTVINYFIAALNFQFIGTPVQTPLTVVVVVVCGGAALLSILGLFLSLRE